jgi:D-3-phosphoglycerate dehydrogenase / 2-oxoglutarate reductase
VNPSIVILEPDGYPERALAMLRSCREVVLNRGGGDPSHLLDSAEILIVRLKFLLDKTFLERAPKLKLIATGTTGLDHIDLSTANARGIIVLSLRGETAFLSTVTATAEHTWALLLALLRHIPEAHRSVINGEWDRTPFFGRELQGQTLGIVGLGRIGRMVAQYGLAFRMRVIGYDPYASGWVEGVGKVGNLNELIHNAVIISVHVPLSEETLGLIGKTQFSSMKRGSILLNTSRGAVLDEAALLEALEGGQIGGAALDVIHDEYNSASGPREQLIRYAASHTNLLITPHLGGATFESLEKVELFMAEKILKHLRANPLPSGCTR